MSTFRSLFLPCLVVSFLAGCGWTPPAPDDAPTPAPRRVAVAMATPTPDVRADLQQGIALVLHHQLDSAIPRLQHVVMADPRNVEGHFWLFQAYKAQNTPGPAQQEAQTVVSLAPDSSMGRQANDYLHAAAAVSASPMAETPRGVATASGWVYTPPSPGVKLNLPGYDLCIAADHGDLPAAQQILQEHPDVINFTGEKGDHSPPLSFASRYKQEYRSDARDATIQRQLAMVKFLVSKGADVRWRNQDGKTVLFDAEAPEIITFLASHGADVNARDKDHQTALMVASHQNLYLPDFDRWMALIRSGATLQGLPRKAACKMVVEAALQANVEALQKLLSQDRTLARDANYALGSVGSRGCQRRLLELRKRHQVPPFYDPDPDAAGERECIRLLLAAGADVNFRDDHGGTPLSNALRGRSTNVVMALIDEGADVRDSLNDAVGYTNKLEVVSRIIEKGGDVNVRSKDQSTPLMQAAQSSRNNDAIELLLKHGAQIDAVDAEHRTPLMTAITWGNAPSAILFIERGADVNLPDAYGNTPLHVAKLLPEMKDVVALLRRHGARDEGQSSLVPTP
ncbi:MAG: ankyrin repeat domain-containing protein [Candidatus Xenobia bacterium]